MREGSLVETVTCFEHLRRVWGFDYPVKGDILTVSSIVPHHDAYSRSLGIHLLKFVEKPNLPGICDMTIDKKINFKELLPPLDIEEMLKIENEFVQTL